MSTIRICIFRHGETDWNHERRLQGLVDIPLNKTGRGQALSLAAVLELFRPEEIASSDLSRAYETASIAAQNLAIPIIKSQALRECDFGLAEGMTRDEIGAQFGPRAFERFLSSNTEDFDYGFERGETKRQHLERIIGFLSSYLSNQTLTRIAISCHAGVIWRLLSAAVNGPRKIPAIPHCAPFFLEFNRITGQLAVSVMGG